MATAPAKPSRDELLEVGREFQDHVCEVLARRLGLALTPYSSKRGQYDRGETIQGVEIKNDRELHKTGNIYVEVAEKSHAGMPDYSPSGIYRDDNSWLWVIGDHSVLYFLPKNYLQRLHAVKLENGAPHYKRVKTPTSRGFLIPRRDAEFYSVLTIHTDGEAGEEGR